MMLNKPQQFTQSTIDLRRAIISAVTAFIVTAVIFLALSFLVLISVLPETLIRPLSVITALIASFFSGFLTSRNVPMYGLLNGVVTGGIYFLITYIFCAIILLKLSFSGDLFTTLLAIIIGSSIGGIFGINKRAARYRNIRRRRRR